MNPQQLRYSTSDEWIAVDGDVATVGITDLAVQALTDLVFIELPKPGKSLAVGQVFGVVESVKAASDLYSPVAGTVLEVNSKLSNDLSHLSSDPFGKGWLMKVRLSSPPSDTLLDRAGYEANWQTRH